MASQRGIVLGLVAAFLIIGGTATATPVKGHAPTKAPKPAVSRVTPHHGPAAGGDVVRIKGKHLTGAKKVTFGRKNGHHLKVVSANKLIVTAPKHRRGTVDVRVLTKSGRSAKHKADHYKYVARSTGAGGKRWTSSGPIEHTAGSPRSVSCPTARFCAAVDFDGAALSFDGSTWSAPASINDGQLWSVSCLSASYCLAVGDTRVNTVKLTDTFVYNGSIWTRSRSTIPRLDTPSVSCVSTSYCVVVGVTDSGDAWASFNGSRWSADKPMNGDGSLGVTGVSCTSTTFCAAVGASYNNYAAAQTFNGTTWSAVARIGPVDSEAEAVSCVTPQFCEAIGDDSLLSARGYTYDGSGWATTSLELAHSSGRSISCPTATACRAVGDVESGDGGREGWVATMSGSAWTTDSSGHGGGLNSVSCANPKTCVAVGEYLQPITVSQSTNHAIRHLDGYATQFTAGAWQPPASIDPEVGRGTAALACPSASFCVAADLGGTVQTWNGNRWSAPDPVAVDDAQVDTTNLLSAGPTAVSCASAKFCLLLGSDVDSSGEDSFGFASRWNGDGWTKPADIDPGQAIRDVSCGSASFCVAVDDGGQAVVYDGSWESPSTVDGVGLSAVSCASRHFCAAVDDGGNALVTTNGATWSPQLLAGSATAYDVSCTSTSYCLAVVSGGRFSRYDGSTWSTPAPIRGGGEPTRVSCTSASYCLAVDAKTGASDEYDGSTWAVGKVIDHKSHRGGYLSGLSCVSRTLCYASDYFGDFLVGNG